MKYACVLQSLYLPSVLFFLFFLHNGGIFFSQDMFSCNMTHEIVITYEMQNDRCIYNSLKICRNINILRPRQNGRQFPDDIFKCIFLNENVWISIKISLKFVPKGPINNIPALVQIMPWHRPGDRTLSEPMMVKLLTHICYMQADTSLNVPA